MAGQVVLDEKRLIEGKYQFARPPYLVSFRSGWFEFDLCAVNIFYGSPHGEKLQRRIGEIDTISKLMKHRVKTEDKNVILLGDFNFDGTIDFADYTVLQNNFGTGTTFGEGDFNFDGVVGLADFIALKAAFNAPAGAAAVPEPAGFSLLGIASVALLLRRRRLRGKVCEANNLVLTMAKRQSKA